MNFGKIVFAQIMQFIPRREFNDIVAKYSIRAFDQSIGSRC